jgi:UDP-N-acetylglucosamine--N-acetylmuramyl-(pentapeptide) pyrophosphoryl-undecaprenol N-acetylglucosamine transferase
VHDALRSVVVFSGGGTGGHLYPALALAEALVQILPEVRPFFVGATRGVEARILPARGLEHALLPVEGFHRGTGLRSLRALPRLGVSLLHVGDLFQRLRPEAVVVTGGYAGGPAGIAAGMGRIPLVIQEQNAIPGVTTRLLSRWARQVHLAFPEASALLPGAARSKVHVSGNPVRAASALPQDEARRTFGLPLDGVVALVTGGSQGSDALNRTVLDALTGVTSGRLGRPPALRLLWSTGPRHHQDVMKTLATLGAPEWVHAHPYIDDMPAALAAADVAVSRAGAMTTAELTNNGLPAVLVPLPTAAADHQARNAEALAAAGAAVVAPEDGLTGALLWAHVERLVRDSSLRERMADAAKVRARPGAAADIAASVAPLIRGGVRWSV